MAATHESPSLLAADEARAHDKSAQHIQNTPIPAAPAELKEVGVHDQQSIVTAPSTSLFGPFPPSDNPIHGPQNTISTSEPGQTSMTSPSDPIETTGESHKRTDQSVLASNAGLQKPVSLNQLDPLSTPHNAPLPPLLREKTAPAIGPATDKPNIISKDSEVEGPVLFITLLLSSTGARHPFKLDEKYLKKRNVSVDGNNPINMSLYKLKELILRDWREEWEAKPSSPESIRLISMGKLLDDKVRLSGKTYRLYARQPYSLLTQTEDSGFANGTSPHIVHMTIKPQELVDEEDAKMKAAGTGRGEMERSPGCRCIVQ
ncbi:hypothetical protein ACLMJK_003357 [Lecanora helva]